MKKTILAFFLLCATLGLHAATPMFVQTGYCATTTNTTTVTCTFPSAVKAGDFLLAAVNVDNSSGSAFTVSASDTVNGAWTNEQTCFDSFINQGNLFYIPNAKAGSPTITVTSSTATGFLLVVAEYSGVATTSPVDVVGSCNSGYSVTTLTAPNITTTNANDLVINAFTTTEGGPDVTVSSPYVLNTSGSNGAAIASQVVTSAGTITGGTFTATYGGNSSVMTVAFKAAATTTSSARSQIGAFCVGP